MRVVVASDSFKGSLSSIEVGEAVRRGILRADPAAKVAVRPLADGGEGTTQALMAALGARWAETEATGPDGRRVRCRYGISGGGQNEVTDAVSGCAAAGRSPAENGQDAAVRTAVIEIAAAAGLTLVPPERRNPLTATTYGVGELIADAIGRGCRRFVIGLGGSATNDGGAGMLQALGYALLDQAGKPIRRGAQGLREIARIDGGGALPALRECTFRLACDVNNPLCGPNGCSAVYGPQKGATPEMVGQMDGWLARYADAAERYSGRAERDTPGSGAAGGLGFAFRCFLGGALLPGVRLVIEETGLEKEVARADLVVTGEGRLDAQTAMGKAPAGVAALARKYGKPVIALAGCVSEEAGVCNEAGIDAFFPVLHRVGSLEEAMEPQAARRNVEETAEQVFRLVRRLRASNESK